MFNKTVESESFILVVERSICRFPRAPVLAPKGAIGVVFWLHLHKGCNFLSPKDHELKKMAVIFNENPRTQIWL